MFDLMAAGRLAFFEFVSIVLIGMTFSGIAYLYFRRSSGFVEVYGKNQYKPLAEEALQGYQRLFQNYPRWYMFVVVRYKQDEHVVSDETFFTLIGEMIHIKYSDGKWVETTSGSIAALIVIIPTCITSLFLLFSNVSLNASLISSKQMMFGQSLLFSLAILAPVLLVINYVNYLNFPTK